MKQFCMQSKAFFNVNKTWMLLLAAYAAIMVSIMGKVQSDVPFISMHNFFYTEGIVIIIFIVQSMLLISTFFKNAANAIKGEERESAVYAINNIIVSVIFSLLISIFITCAFLVSLYLFNHSFFSGKNSEVYYFGIYMKGINTQNVLQMIIYTFSANMVVMAISNLLSSIEKKWHYVLSILLVILLFMCMILRDNIAMIFSKFFETYGSPYSISVVLVLITIGIMAFNYIIVEKSQHQ